MVFAAYGVDHTEEEIYACCGTDPDGTLPSAAARCAQQLGFGASAVRLAGLDELRGYIDTALAL
jgi:ABC-type bacteriocin/lantibiotic exporter with double-glycine peptidase domain